MSFFTGLSCSLNLSNKIGLYLQLVFSTGYIGYFKQFHKCHHVWVQGQGHHVQHFCNMVGTTEHCICSQLTSDLIAVYHRDLQIQRDDVIVHNKAPVH